MNVYRFASLLCSALLAASPVSSFALMLGDHQVAEETHVADTTLALNGAGIRSKAYFKVYLAALYLGKHEADPAAVLDESGPKRLQITFLRDVDGQMVSRSMREGLDDNCDEDERRRFAPYIREFTDMFGKVDTIHSGDVIDLDWVPGTGMIARVNGHALQTPLLDQAFYNVVLRIWLGEHPVSSDLKQRLLGQDA